MKYKLTFYSAGEIILPVQYNHILQAALLNWLGDKAYTDFLHNKGYQNEKRNIKLYTFSNLYGKYVYKKETRNIVFTGKISFYCSFYEKDADDLIWYRAQCQKPFILGGKKLAFVQCEHIEEKYKECLVETVSPITIHSTVELPNNRKRTYYFEPFEKEFSDMIRENLIRKYKAYHGCEPEDTRFWIECLNNQQYKLASIYYHDFVIKGWRGKFLVRGSKELIELALLSGIGARNGIGCGCVIQVWEDK